MTTSHEFDKLVHGKLKQLYEDLLKNGAKNKPIAKKYHVSPSEISALRKEMDSTIESHQSLYSLVDVPQTDKTIANDETFLRIEAYIIVAMGYMTHNVLGVNVFFSRKVEDM